MPSLSAAARRRIKIRQRWRRVPELPLPTLNHRALSNIQSLISSVRDLGRALDNDPSVERTETMEEAIDTQVLGMEVEADWHYLQVTSDLPIGQGNVSGNDNVYEIFHELRGRMVHYGKFVVTHNDHRRTIKRLLKKLHDMQRDEDGIASQEDTSSSGHDGSSSDEGDDNNDSGDGVAQSPDTQANGEDNIQGNVDAPERCQSESTTLAPESDDDGQPNGLPQDGNEPSSRPNLAAAMNTRNDIEADPGNPATAPTTHNAIQIDPTNAQNGQDRHPPHNETQDSVQRWVNDPSSRWARLTSPSAPSNS